MRMLPFHAVLLVCLLAGGAAGRAQEQAQPKTAEPAPAEQGSRPAEPGTQDTQLKPASKAPAPVQVPDVRLDSKPHTDIDYTVDSSKEAPDLGLGASPEMDLGHDITATTPPGMLSRSELDNPRSVYFALPHRAGEGISPDDSTAIAARQGDLIRAAAFKGFNLRQAGWMYQQGVCPAMQPDAEQIVGVPAAGEGFILLHFIRSDGGGHSSAFTAVVPRDASLPVRAVAVARHSVENNYDFLAPKGSGAVVNEALPPAILYKNMEPEKDWIAASACIAEVGGAYPHIANEPFLTEDILTAPPPLIRLLRNGDRKITFTDRVDDRHYVVWDEHVSNHGRMLDGEHKAEKIKLRPVTNPPTPKSHMLAEVPQPKSHILPPPPSPLSGEKQ